MLEFGAISKESQQSSLRQIASKITQPLALELHHRFPWLTPNHVTIIGLIGVISALGLNEIAQRKEKPHLSNLGLVLYLRSSALDAVDGALARVINANNGKHDSMKGQLIDVVSDKTAETLICRYPNF